MRLESEQFFSQMKSDMESSGVDNMSIQEAMMWFRVQMRDMGVFQHTIAIQQKLVKQGELGIFPQFGHFNIFLYPDPKYKLSLPYYDILPIVLPLERKLSNGTFLGLNFHYLPYFFRIKFLRLLEERYMIEDDAPEGGIIPITWNKIKNLKFPKACVRRYIHKNIKSKIRYLRGDDIKTMSMMPVQKFMEVDRRIRTEQVFRDTTKIIRGSV